MIVVGLTGSIGMGKSTTAQMFADAGIPVSNSDAVVHDLYRSEAVEPIRKVFPGSIKNGVVDRSELARILTENPAKFQDLEAIVHPLVRRREDRFRKIHEANGVDIVVLDIPLLFETHADERVDVVVVVTCNPDVQWERVLARPGMTPKKLEAILARQLPDAQKRERADFVIDTGHGMDVARQRVHDVILMLRAGRPSGANDA